jgi:hypothetical protein
VEHQQKSVDVGIHLEPDPIAFAVATIVVHPEVYRRTFAFEAPDFPGHFAGQAERGKCCEENHHTGPPGLRPIEPLNQMDTGRTAFAISSFVPPSYIT